MIDKKQTKNDLRLENLRKKYGERISKVRKASQNRQQKKFADMLNISQPQLSAIESGRSALSIGVVYRITQLRISGKRINMDWLFTGEGHMLMKELLKKEKINIRTLKKRLDHLDSKQIQAIVRLIDSFAR